ncbi:hypothetical protein [Streptomyces sp. enrichment culture]|uniref:hypothetical protein n=1 Tax=Streptomyces sp. enrichment culture TaxID=1795815 RepID=UPI003F5640F2
MTQSIAPGTAVRLGRVRWVLRAVAVVSCLPYLGLRTAWTAGSRLGTPEGSALLDDRLAMAVINALSVLPDSAVTVLALMPTRPAHAGQLLAGFLVAALGVCYFAERAAGTARRTA